MEKQIIIKHRSKDITLKIKEIMICLRLFVNVKDKVICYCRLNLKQTNVLDKIKFLEQCNILDCVKIETFKNQETIDCEVVVYFEHIEQFLNIVEKYELNVLILQNNIKVFINDNDGDFIIINSNHEKYNTIRKQI
ncbi:MAG: hypothetical protein IKC56_05095 [Clostridia bacterium]|nr:hypothetical protein [Clostridia bacterium]